MKFAPFRKLLSCTAAALVAVTGGTVAQAEAPTAQQPEAASAPQGGQRPRNVIFILVDDLRVDGLGFLQPGIKTPNIDRLAAGGSSSPVKSAESRRNASVLADLM